MDFLNNIYAMAANSPEYTISYLMLVLIASAVASPMSGMPVSVAAEEIKYVDSGNGNNFIIFNAAEHSYYLHQTDGNYGGTYTETSMSYSLSPFGYTIEKAGNDAILSPTGREWKRV